MRKLICTYLFPSTAKVQKGIIPFWRLHSVTSRTARVTFIFSFIMACWVDILNNVRREVSKHFRNKKKACLRAKIEELETNSKIQNIRDLYCIGASVTLRRGTSLDVI